MSTYLKSNRIVLMRLTWEYIGNKAYEYACKDEYGFVPVSYYEKLHEYVIFLRALQFGILTDAQEEPILECLAKLVNDFPAVAQISEP